MKKIISSVISLILAAAVIIAVWIGSSGFKNWKVKTWFNGWGKGSTNIGGNSNGNGSNDGTTENFTGSVLDNGESNGMQLLSARIPRTAYAANGIAETADSAYTLTANIVPHYATNPAIDWSVSWANPSSDWATDKEVTDYVTVTPTTDGGLTAICVCLQDFGEMVLITVSSRENSKISASCMVNYYQRVKGIEYRFKYDGEEIETPSPDGHDVYKVDYLDEAKNYTVEAVPIYSAYTLFDTFTTSISGKFSSEFGCTAVYLDNDIQLLAGLSGGDPELSENARNWITYVQNNVFEYTSFNIESVGIGVGLCLGNDVYAHGHKIVPKYKLTDEEKQHPRCAYYISILSNSSNFQTADAWNAAKTVFNSYQAAGYSYMSGITFKTFENFISSVSRCNNAGVGVMQYTVSVSGTYSNYSTVLNLSYKDELLTSLRDIIMSDTSVNF